MRSALGVLVLSWILVAHVYGRKSTTAVRTIGNEQLVEELRIGKEPFEAVRDMHNMWYVHSLKGLLVQMAKDLVRKLDKVAERDLLLCLHRIIEKTDIVRASQCLVAARRTLFEPRVEEPSAFIVVGQDEESRERKFHPKKNMKLVEHFRVKRSEHRLVEEAGAKKQRSRVRKSAVAPHLLSAGLTPVQSFSKAMMTVVNGKEEETKLAWSKTYASILEMKKGMDKQWQSPSARLYDQPMDRLVFDKNLTSTGTLSLARNIRMPDMVERAFALANSVKSHSSTRDKDSNVKMLSPRFAPVMPDKYEGKGSLSPSILAFYKDDSEDQIIPLPSLLDASGMQKKDRDSLLEMIMEVSGARKTVDAAFETLKKINLYGVEGPFLEVARKLEEVFRDLEKSFTRRQKAEMRKRKFAFLNKAQLTRLYEKQGIEKHQYEDFDLDAYDKLTHAQRHESLWKRIEIFAENRTDSDVGHRSKRQVVIPDQLSVLSPTVLAPYMFKPIYGLSVLGPTVLSPSLFSPLILNPSVISPWVLSPAIGMPFILSPYLLSPYVLSPMVMDPFILSPYVLSPNVINPYVLSPLILSPLALCPDVLSPMIVGGNILSPSFASPQVFTKNFLTASVLSPTFLS